MQQYSKENVMFENLSYEEAVELMNKSVIVLAITRPEWQGYHLNDRFEGGTNLGYLILTKDDTLIVNPKEIYNKDDKDWQVVMLTQWQIVHLLNKIEALEVSQDA